ncbi:hypothetical protein Patl1_22042 [Pistacia atlantica]|uniref:Uncharacterized protein n=1 Tax=Pistacia atlantica TaxID=434234 RepID=A0ACC1BNQ8_9ROSI|nr:hypothetical protein Patl1_22042 [Pistacia atlantica]
MDGKIPLPQQLQIHQHHFPWIVEKGMETSTCTCVCLCLSVGLQTSSLRPSFPHSLSLLGTLLGAMTGALIVQETESGFVRGAAVGAISGAVFSIEVFESSLVQDLTRECYSRILATEPCLVKDCYFFLSSSGIPSVLVVKCKTYALTASHHVDLLCHPVKY